VDRAKSRQVSHVGHAEGELEVLLDEHDGHLPHAA
jgi:hypothetical protein